MSGSKKLFEIKLSKQGRIEYFYNRQQGRDTTELLSISDDGTIYIGKCVISSPDIVVALISALIHALEIMRNGGAFAPVLDDYVQLFADMWHKEYLRVTEGEDDD